MTYTSRMEEISDFIHRLRGQLKEAKPLDREPTLDNPRRVAEYAAKRVAHYGYGSPELSERAECVEGPDDAYKVLVECLAALPKLAEQPEPEPGDYLEPSDVAAMLGVSADKVREWCSTRQLRGANINNGERARWIITREDLETFLETRRAPQPVAASTHRNGSSGPY